MYTLCVYTSLSLSLYIYIYIYICIYTYMIARPQDRPEALLRAGRGDLGEPDSRHSHMYNIYIYIYIYMYIH